MTRSAPCRAASAHASAMRARFSPQGSDGQIELGECDPHPAQRIGCAEPATARDRVEQARGTPASAEAASARREIDLEPHRERDALLHTPPIRDRGDDLQAAPALDAPLLRAQREDEARAGISHLDADPCLIQRQHDGDRIALLEPRMADAVRDELGHQQSHVERSLPERRKLADVVEPAASPARGLRGRRYLEGSHEHAASPRSCCRLPRGDVTPFPGVLNLRPRADTPRRRARSARNPLHSTCSGVERATGW